MVKRAIIVSLLLLAYTCVLVHNLIPHHHHQYSTHKSHHHDGQYDHEEHHHHDNHSNTDHNSDDTDKKDPINHAFGFHQHQSADKQIEHVLSLTHTHLKFKVKTLLLPVDLLNFYLGPPKIPDDPPESSYYSLLVRSFQPSFFSRRAAPAIIS
jgi:hypothetical protein